MEHRHTELYERLGVAADATQDEIKKAYRRSARKLMHASHGESNENEEYFKKAYEAYKILSDEYLRKIYDREGLDGVQKFHKEEEHRKEAENLRINGPGIFSGPWKNPDSNYDVYATLEEFYFGTTKKLKYTRGVTCPKSCQVPSAKRPQQEDPHDICSNCNGKRTIEESRTVSLNIYPGDHDGKQIILTGQGSRKDPTLAAGGLCIRLKQLDHPTFKRQNTKLILDVTLPLARFTNGFEIVFKHLGGYVVIGKSDPYIVIRDGDIFRVQGEGMPNEYQQRGDLFIRFHDSNESGVICSSNKIELTTEMPCETQVKYVTAEKVDEIPPEGCAQQ